MRSTILAAVAMSALLNPGPLAAADLPKGALCALADIHECDAGSACERVTADDIAVPRFIRVEFAQKTMRGVGPRARDRVSKIASVDQRGDTIFAQGIDEAIQGQRSALGWTFALGAKDGSMQLTVSTDDATFVAAGECLIDN